jgi:hypothetical protein
MNWLLVVIIAVVVIWLWQVLGWLGAALAAAAGVAAFLIRTRYWPYGPCPACTGRRGKGPLSTDSAYNRRCKCGGKGERIRPLALIWPKHRAEAQRRRDEVRKQREAGKL